MHFNKSSNSQESKGIRALAQELPLIDKITGHIIQLKGCEAMQYFIC